MPGLGNHAIVNPGTFNPYAITSGTFNDVARDAQICLTSLNYNVGGCDGLYGTTTKKYILDFQKKYGSKYGLAATGTLDEATLKALQKEAGPSIVKRDTEWQAIIANSNSLLSKTDYALADPMYYLNFTNPIQSGIDPIFAGRLAAFARDNNIAISITSNGGKRNGDDQVRAYINSGGYKDKNGNWVGGNGKAAVPGTSWHENGEAVDVKNQSIKSLYGDWASTENQKKLTAYGIFKPLTTGNGVSSNKSEDWHIQPIETQGISANKRRSFYNAYNK